MTRSSCGMLLLVLAHLGFPGNSAWAQSAMTSNASNVAKKDYASAQAKILRDYDYAVAQCSKRTGPAERACEIQVQAKREADEDEARLTVDRAGNNVPLPDQARKRASEEAGTRAKGNYKVALRKIVIVDRTANTECAKLYGADRKTCISEVAGRTARAKQQAKYNYTRDMARAKSMKVP